MMTATVVPPITSGDSVQSVVGWLDRLRVVALDGLRQMYLPSEQLFCFKACYDGNKLLLKGVSPRYSAMSVIGYCAGDRSKNVAGWPVHDVCNRLCSWVKSEASIGESGLVLWALLQAEHVDSTSVVHSIAARECQLTKSSAIIGSMELGYLLTGLSESVMRGIEVDICSRLAGLVCDILLQRQGKTSGLFPICGYASRRKPVVRWMRNRLGSFASQVYPIVGLSAFSMACKRRDALKAAKRCLNTVCQLQGADGQWWWIYHVDQGKVVVRFPVYSVHQDAMGPMAILAVEKAGGVNHNENFYRSFHWFAHRPELPDRELIDQERRVVWRAIQRDEPVMTGAFGLGAAERRRMMWASLTGKADINPFLDGWVCSECRPYHLGWVLLADAWFKACRRTSESK